MRLPLGNGLPFLLTGGSAVDVIYDLSAQVAARQNRINFVTLYAFLDAAGDGSGNTNLQSLLSNGTTAEFASLTNSVLEAAQLSALATQKILDRFPMRGNMVLQIEETALQAAQAVYVWGYIELEGENDPPRQLRALQPDNDLVSPFSTPVYTAKNNAPAFSQIHLLQPGFTDEIYLDVSMHTPEGADTHLVFSNGASSVDILLLLSALIDSGTFRFFDGIPILGLSAGGGITGNTDGADTDLYVFGHFFRR